MWRLLTSAPGGSEASGGCRLAQDREAISPGVGYLAPLIEQAAERSQLWVVSHSTALTEALGSSNKCTPVVLQKELGETQIAGQSSLIDRPSWAWPPT